MVGSVYASRGECTVGGKKWFLLKLSACGAKFLFIICAVAVFNVVI